MTATRDLKDRVKTLQWWHIFTSSGTPLADKAERLEAIPARRVWVMAEANE